MFKEALEAIQKEKKTILVDLDVGDPAGETDRLLDECHIETITFWDLFSDKKDLIIGPKGSGKSSLFILVSKYLKHILKDEKNIIVIKGVTQIGAPVYTEYSQEFSTFRYQDFQNFWDILFINLIYRELICDDKFFDKKKKEEFEKLCNSNGLILSDQPDDSSLLKSTIDRTRNISANVKAGATGGEVGVNLDLAANEVGDIFNMPSAIKTRDILKYVYDHLEYLGQTVWITLDQLDQAFERYSQVEKRALHTLISTSLNLNSEFLKLKIFLRDDIFEQIYKYRGIVNSDHLRISDTLLWEEIDLLKLIIKRLMHNKIMLQIFSSKISKISDIDNLTKEECLDIFYVLFPNKCKKGAETWSYLLRELKDGNERVTPRELISLIDHARNAQLKKLNEGSGGDRLFSQESIEKALSKCSEQKIVHFLLAEFPYVSKLIDKLKFGTNKYDDNQLQKQIGKIDYEKNLKQLQSIGVLKRKGEKATIWVGPIYQRGLQVTQRRESKKK